MLQKYWSGFDCLQAIVVFLPHYSQNLYHILLNCSREKKHILLNDIYFHVIYLLFGLYQTILTKCVLP